MNGCSCPGHAPHRPNCSNLAARLQQARTRAERAEATVARVRRLSKVWESIATNPTVHSERLKQWQADVADMNRQLVEALDAEP